ncbi:hypothetical protein [Nostoc sp. PCC 9305]
MLNRTYGNPSSPAEEYDGDERINMAIGDRLWPVISCRKRSQTA